MAGTKTIQEITQADLDAMKRHKSLLQYNQSDIYQLDALVKQYINQFHKTCLGCSGGALRSAKDQINNLLAVHGEEMQKILDAKNAPQLPEETQEEKDVKAAVEQTKQYKNKKKKDGL